MICPNCSTETIGPYCHECGHETENARFTMRGLFKDLLFEVLELEDQSLPKTILRLAKEPGKVIRDVIQGQRRSLYPPFKFLLLIGAVVILFSLRYRFFSNEYTQVESGQTHILFGFIFIPEAYRAFLENFFRFAEDYATLLNIAAIPIFALFSFWWLSKGKYNFAENLVLNTFITGEQLFFLLLFIPFYEFLPGSKTTLIFIYTIGVTVYNFWVYIQFFGGSAGNVLKSAAVVAVGYLGQFPLNFLIFYVYQHYVSVFIQWIPKA